MQKMIAFLLGAVGALAFCNSSLAGEGFGTMNKDFAVVTRVHPPEVFLAGTRMGFKASGQDSNQASAAERLRVLLESELLSADSRLTTSSARVETLIELTVVQDSGSTRWDTRTVVRRVDTGTKDGRGKTIYRDQEEQVRYETVTHTFSVAYKASDARSNSTLDADTFTINYSDDFAEGAGAPDLASLETTAITRIVETIRSRLTPTNEEVGVLLPRGSFKDLNNLASAGLWNQYLEAVQGLPERPNAEDESYRQYCIGLAYEALGYSAGSIDDTLRYLQQASAYYNLALQANPGEKYFSQPYERKSFNWSKFLKPASKGHYTSSSTYPPPLERVRDALVDYQRTKEFHPIEESRGKSVGQVESGVTGSDAEAGALTNQDVIDMVKAGLAEEVILTAIDSAKSEAFDVSAKGLIELTKGKVNKAIIQHIQTKAAQR